MVPGASASLGLAPYLAGQLFDVGAPVAGAGRCSLA